MNDPKIMTAEDGEKIIDINGKPFIIPDNQVTDKSKMVKCEFYMLSDDLEFLVQDQLDGFAMWHTTAEELWHDKPLSFKKMEGSGEAECWEMADLHQRLYHYLKPFTKQEED
tara:strand:+ start:617 stop:952 length:336 start_codon:yes stop_codon:yes gene_type:complete